VVVTDVLRFAVGSAILLYASVSDLRWRRVPNRTWLIGGAIALAILAVDALAFDRIRGVYLVLVPIIIVLAYVSWYFHLLAGGADAKALMMLAALVPYPLDWATSLPRWTSPLPPAAVSFANSLLVFLALPLLFLVFNLLRGDVRFPTMLLGYTLSLDEAQRRFVWVTERVDDAGRVRQVLMSSKQTPEEQAENIARLRAAGRTRAWVTPKIPFMVPLFAGFLAAFVLGDVFTKLLSLTILRGRG